MDSSRMEVEDGEHIGDEYEFTEGVHGGEVESRNKNGLDMEVDHDAKQGQGGKEKSRDSGKHRSKDRKKERREEKEHGSRDRERSKNHDSTKNKDYNLEASDTKEKDRVMTRERRDDREEYSKEKERDKERNMEKVREKDYDNAKYRDREHVRDKDREKELVRGKDRGRERDKDRERDRDREKESERSRVRIRDHDKQSERDWKKDRGKEKELEREKDRDRDREGEKEWDRGKDKEREKEKGRDREKEKDKDRDKLETDKGKEKIREKDKDREKTKERENDKVDGRNRDRYEKEITKVKDRKRDEKLRTDSYEDQDMDKQETGRDTHGKFSAKDDKKKVEASNRSQSTLQLEERVLKMKEERLKKSEGASEVLAWVSKSRVLEEKRTAQKQKALQLSKVFEEQDNLDHGENEDEEAGATSQRGAKDLAGVKILHGLDKVAEGGAVVLTLKDQNILANGDINEEVDMLENVEIGEQKQRDEAYKAAKTKTGIYDDKFSDDPGSQRAILPQYDDPVQDEGITLDESGRFTGEAEKKLEELRKRLQGASTSNRFEDLTSSGKMSSDFYTQEEMLQFKKPKKKKSLRKKNKLDLDALEAEAISAGLGAGDLGSRDEAKRRALKEERERSEAEIRSNAYQSAVAKAEEASKALRMEQTLTFQTEAENPVFGDDDEDLYKSLEKARKLALKKHGESAIYGPQAVALLAVSNNQSGDKLNTTSEEPEENKVVFTEMEEFVWGLQLDEETHKPEAEDVFLDEEVIPKSIEETKDEAGGWTEVKESGEDESPVKEQKEDIVADNTIHEPAVGKGLSGALQLLKERGTLKEDVDWGGRNMDKKKSKLVGINDNDGPKEIRIDRLDEFGRIMTPKEAFRMISHKFHGKGPGKTKQEKRMKQYHEELKLKQMKASDTPSQSMERMREAQARLQSPYLVLSGHVKPGQTSDPRSGFATVEKDHPGSLTPMLGDRKVEHFLGIKRKAEPSNMGPPKKPKI